MSIDVTRLHVRFVITRTDKVCGGQVRTNYSVSAVVEGSFGYSRLLLPSSGMQPKEQKWDGNGVVVVVVVVVVMMV